MTLRTKERQRVVKALLSTLLGLDLKPADLRQLRNEIAHGEIMHELSFLLGYLSDHFSEYGSDEEQHSDDSLVGEIMAFVQRKRLSKSQFLAMMRDISDEQLDIGNSSKVTMKEIAETFSAFADESQIARLRALMSDTSDPYLQGILKRLM